MSVSEIGYKPIMMLDYLKKVDKATSLEIAEAINTNARNIRIYRKCIEAAGYKIKSIPGRAGGLALEK